MRQLDLMFTEASKLPVPRMRAIMMDDVQAERSAEAAAHARVRRATATAAAADAEAFQKEAPPTRPGVILTSAAAAEAAAYDTAQKMRKQAEEVEMVNLTSVMEY